MAKQRFRVLHVEDVQFDAELMANAFERAGRDVAWTRVETEAEYVSALESAPHVVIADYSLPQFSGLRALEILKQARPEIPFILVSGTIGEEKAAEAMRLGADDYLLKDRLGRLPAAVEKAVHEAQDRAAHSKAKADFEAGLRRAQAMAQLAHVITGPDGAFESWSETLPQLAGVDAAHLPATTRAWLNILHPQDRALFRAKSKAARRTQQRTDVEYRLQRADGALIHVRQSMEPLAVEPGAEGRLRWFNTLQDITESKLAEARIRRLNRVYAVLSGINQAIVRIRDRGELFQESCRIAVEAGGFVMAWIGVVDHEASMIKPVASAGDVRGFFDAAPLAIPENAPGGHGPAGRAIRSKVPVVSNDVKSDLQRPMRKELEERSINSFAIIPLIVNDEAVGVFALHAADAGFFDAQEMRLLAELAGDVSFVLEHIEKTEKLDYISYYDPLTGAPNRTLFHERLRLQLDDAARKNEKLALLIVDIGRFKTINDTLGRHAGDGLLRGIANRIRQGGHPTSWFARVGADHFAIVVPQVTSREELARHVEARLDRIFANPFTVVGTELRISARIGIAGFPDDGTDGDTLLRNAEAALKNAKATGERYLFYTQEMSERNAENLSLENKLRQAIERQEFVLHYQPKVDLDKRDIVGVEALIRWQSPELGLVPPAQFIPLLEETGLILQVGSWALRRAALDHRAWVEQKLKAPRVAVNVSQIQLRQRDFVRVVEEAIIDGVAPTGIDLELTESLIMQDVQANIEKLDAVRRLGVRIAIDDFGTGYSSLAYLAKLPVATLKIDRAFIHSMLDDADTATLVQTVISMAHALRLKVVAEGVESEAQAKALRLLRCDEMQGYVFSKPLPLEQMTALLRAAR
ncbi:MAG TPA: EAL domain-containing protein [Burkholderiales bacterium]|nr:EAL domain-containing protein [Burkholderiales bacterium]